MEMVKKMKFPDPSASHEELVGDLRWGLAAWARNQSYLFAHAINRKLTIISIDSRRRSSILELRPFPPPFLNPPLPRSVTLPTARCGAFCVEYLLRDLPYELSC